MDQNHDKVFYKTFSIVLGSLFGIFFICIVAARMIVSDAPPEGQAERVAERLRPVGTVITDPAALLKVSAAATRAPLSGEQVAGQVCNACHGTGVLAAPKSGDRLAWGERQKAAGGLDGLVASAIKGKNAMPPRGGDASLTDAEVKAAVEHIIKAGV